MDKKIDKRYKNSFKDEYEAMYEAVYGSEPPSEEEDVDYSLPGSSNHSDICPYEQTRDYVSYFDDQCDSKWFMVPNLIMEKVFKYLSMRDKYNASIVCRNSYNCFHLPNAWRIFVFDDRTLTRRLFNYYSGWQYMLDHLRAQLCLNSVGRYFKTLIFKPINNFYNLYEFMNMISFYAEHRDDNRCDVKEIGSLISSLQYTFPCGNMYNQQQNRLYGTGGKLLDALKRLMSNLPSLKHLELIDLLLEHNDALELLDDVCYSQCLIIETLVLINISKTECQLLHLGVFLHLKELTISPQNLGEEVLYLLSETKLRHLHILQNSYTPAVSELISIPSSTWRKCRLKNPLLRVHLRVDSKFDTQLLWQEGAPVATVLINSPIVKIDENFISQTVDFYSTQLTAFGHLGLTRYYQHKSFNERIDSMLIYLCNQCKLLQTIVLTEKVSTATILLISHSAKNLRHFYVRRNLVIQRSDWDKNPEWSGEFYEWLTMSSRCYSTTEEEVSKKLGYKWTMLSDKEFKCIKPILY